MELMPALKLGWLNGWIMLGSFYLVFGMLMLLFPRDIVARLYDISGLSVRQRALSTIGQPFVLACQGLIIFSPLKIGQDVFVIGCALFMFGLVGMLAALFTYRNTPGDQLVTGGLYRVSRNPQWMALSVMYLGCCVAIGSWVAVILYLVSAAFIHFRILGEETACLKQYGESYREYMGRVPRYFLFF